MVRCFRIWQSERLEQQMLSTQIQLWNGHFQQKRRKFDVDDINDIRAMAENGRKGWSR